MNGKPETFFTDNIFPFQTHSINECAKVIIFHNS
jgi:hypothetical protein